MAVSFNPLINFSWPGEYDESRVMPSLKSAIRSTYFSPPLVGIYGSRLHLKDPTWVCFASSGEVDTMDNSFDDDKASISKPPSPSLNVTEVVNGPLPNSKPKVRRTLSAVKERLRAARIISLSRKTETKAVPKPEFGRNVLDFMRESEKGKKRTRLPEAPTNMFEDDSRGISKEGLVFEFPGGSDVLLIVVSAAFISTVMFGTFYIVWKAGAIHFNEY